jgi:hypothetical protein
VRGDGAGVIAGGSITRKGGIARVDAADMWVPPVIDGRGEKLTPSGFWPGGPWAASRAGLNGIPRPVFIFILFSSYSFSVFPISFLLFAKMLQINSNHFQKFSKN